METGMGVETETGTENGAGIGAGTGMGTGFEVLEMGMGEFGVDFCGAVCLGDRMVPYRLIGEECRIGFDGAASGSVFSFSYFRTDVADAGSRPVLFAFNGGPGSSSCWLHLGLFGPRRARFGDAVNPDVLPSYGLEDNPLCMLDGCDLVMIDPPGTGFADGTGRSSGGGRGLFGAEEDAAAVALFIGQWLRKYGRMQSPKYLAGESYGTVRICFLLRELTGGPFCAARRLQAVPVNGVILLGTAISMELYGDSPKVYRAVRELDSLACVNRYFNREGKPEISEWLKQVREFAAGEYLAALFLGEGLGKEMTDRVCERLAYYTGIEKEWFVRHDFQISSREFAKKLLAKRGLEIGLYDGRYMMKHVNAGVGTSGGGAGGGDPADPVGDDPAMGKYTALFAGAFEVFKTEVGLKTEKEYRLIDFNVNGKWNYMAESGITPMQCLTFAMRRNESMRVFFGSGLYDLVTHAGEVRYVADHMHLDRDRVRIREYESGHMPYLGEESAKALNEDLREFLGLGKGSRS